MDKRTNVMDALVLIFLFGLFVSSALTATAFSPNNGIIVVVKTNKTHYSGEQRINITGIVLFTPNQGHSFSPDSSAAIIIMNPKGEIVAFASVRLHSYRFEHAFTSGGELWFVGKYRVIAIYQACYQEPPYCVLYPGFTTFNYTPALSLA